MLIYFLPFTIEKHAFVAVLVRCKYYTITLYIKISYIIGMLKKYEIDEVDKIGHKMTIIEGMQRNPSKSDEYFI